MPGSLTISTLSDGTNSTSATNCIRGSAKAFAYTNGTTGSLEVGYGFSSVTKVSTGRYSYSLSTAAPDANYAITLGTNAGGFPYIYVNRTTAGFSVETANVTFSGPQDNSHSVMVMY